MSEIKRCPRCGGQPELVSEKADLGGGIEECVSSVKCGCGAGSGPYAGTWREESVIEAWNNGEIFPNKPIVIDTEYLRKR